MFFLRKTISWSWNILLTFLGLGYIAFNKLGPWRAKTVLCGKRKDNSRSVRERWKTSCSFSSSGCWLSHLPFSKGWECWSDWKHARILGGPSLLVTRVPVCEKVSTLDGDLSCVSPVYVAWVVRTNVHFSRRKIYQLAWAHMLSLFCLSCFLILSSSHLTLQQHVTQTLHLASRIPLSFIFLLLHVLSYSVICQVFLIS